VLTHEVLKAAIGGHAKAVRAHLRRMGKKVSLRWLYYQGEPPADVKRLDVYGALWRLFEAIWRANPPGAALLFEDLSARYEALLLETPPPDCALRDQLERCEVEHSDIVKAVIRGADVSRLIAETMEDIREKRLLLVMLKRAAAEREVEGLDVRDADGVAVVATQGAPGAAGDSGRRGPPLPRGGPRRETIPSLNQ